MQEQNSNLKLLSDVTTYSKYAKYLPNQKRRESWEEICWRNAEMHIKKYPQLKKEIENVYREFVIPKKVLASMRSFQFAGRPIELSNNRINNCAYLAIDAYQAFAEIMFLLLGGSGVGYSVQKHDIEKLPAINKPTKQRRFLIGDSIEGWSDAVKVLIKSYFFGTSKPNFDFSDIRKKGTPLKTSGGKAPGPQPLKDCLHNLEKILSLKENGERLKSIEIHDMICHIADAVLAGGIRRAALICLFDLDDEEMIACKSGNWWELNPQRGRANNSAVLVRSEITEQTFFDLWKKIKASGSGEPGIFLTNSRFVGTNPCVEISLRSKTFCNLSELDLSTIEGQYDLNARCKAGAFLGTLQAGYTDFHYLREDWKKRTEEDALIGASGTGIASQAYLTCDLEEAAKIVVEENARVAKIIGINSAARQTCVKPAGCSEFSTKIRTNLGVFSLQEIFEINGFKISDILNLEKQFLETKKEILVYDENNELKSITKLFVNGKSETFEITFEDGTICKFTQEHKFKTNRGWVRADELKEQDDIISYS